MHRLTIISPDISITDTEGRTVQDVAVFDESQLFDLLISVTLQGPTVSKVALIKKAIYHFLEHWEDGERRFTLTAGNFSITTYPTKYINKVEGLIELGERPENPEGEIRHALERTARAMLVSSPKVAQSYQELQDILKKYPTLPIKE